MYSPCRTPYVSVFTLSTLFSTSKWTNNSPSGSRCWIPLILHLFSKYFQTFSMASFLLSYISSSPRDAEQFLRHSSILQSTQSPWLHSNFFFFTVAQIDSSFLRKSIYSRNPSLWWNHRPGKYQRRKLPEDVEANLINLHSNWTAFKLQCLETRCIMQVHSNVSYTIMENSHECWMSDEGRGLFKGTGGQNCPGCISHSFTSPKKSSFSFFPCNRHIFHLQDVLYDPGIRLKCW